MVVFTIIGLFNTVLINYQQILWSKKPTQSLIISTLLLVLTQTCVSEISIRVTGNIVFVYLYICEFEQWSFINVSHPCPQNTSFSKLSWMHFLIDDTSRLFWKKNYSNTLKIIEIVRKINQFIRKPLFWDMSV